MAYDPFASGGPGAYGGTMLGSTETPRRKHISERGRFANGQPLTADPLATLKATRDKLATQIKDLQAKLDQIEAELTRLAAPAKAKVAKKKGAKPDESSTLADNEPAEIEPVTAAPPAE